MAAVATSVVKFAGLSDYVTVLHGDLAKNLPILKSKYKIESVDFFFIDHLKELYTQDFALADSNQLINKVISTVYQY
jgi:catechol O-methyltransferase